MAQTTVNTAVAYRKWAADYFKEYVRDSGFAGYMGTGSGSPFCVKKELISGGQSINISLVGALNGNGTGTGTLVGNEEVLDNSGYQVKPVWRRNAVVLDEAEEHDSSIPLLNASKDALKTWSMDDMRDKIIDALDAIALDTSAYNKVAGHGQQVTYAEASAAQRNTFAANNADRLLFGNDTSNYNATMGTALANVTAAMTLGAAEISFMKRIAKARNRATGRPSVRPIRVEKVTREYFVLFVGSNNFANLKNDSVIINANTDARPREVGSNPLFQDGDLIYDGVIIREVPEIASTGLVGDSSANVAPAYFCGAQALGIAWGRMPQTTKRMEDDYGFIKGVGTQELRGIEKLFYNDRQHGMVTGFFGASADLV